jgi:hypothetical protein
LNLLCHILWPNASEHTFNVVSTEKRRVLHVEKPSRLLTSESKHALKFKVAFAVVFSQSSEQAVHGNVPEHCTWAISVSDHSMYVSQITATNLLSVDLAPQTGVLRVCQSTGPLFGQFWASFVRICWEAREPRVLMNAWASLPLEAVLFCSILDVGRWAWSEGGWRWFLARALLRRNASKCHSSGLLGGDSL